MVTSTTGMANPSPVETKHAKYVERLPQWTKCRDAFEGEDQIKSKGVSYLPKLKGQTDEDYRAYKHRALFYSITGKSVSALVGMATSKMPKVEYPDSMDHYFKGTVPTQFGEIYATALSEILLQSRVGILVDMPSDGGDPYPINYVAEDIINWRTDERGNTIMVVLREEYDKIIDDYTVDVEYRYRELRFDDSGEYVQVIHYPNEPERQEVYRPTVNGRALTRIPFVVIHPQGIGFVDQKPLMLDIANINISHYLSSADLEHGRHFTGLPTPVLIGADSDSDLYIGSTKFLVIPDKGGDAKYLEFTGQGLQSLEKAMSEKQSLLASMSARLLDNSSRGSESEDAVKLRYMSETASLTTIVQAISIALNEVYKWIAEIIREDADSVKITLDTDFMETSMSANEMSAMFDGYFKGAVSVETLVYNLRKGRRLDPLRSDEDEIESISKAFGKEMNVQTTGQSDGQQSNAGQDDQQNVTV